MSVLRIPGSTRARVRCALLAVLLSTVSCDVLVAPPASAPATLSLTYSVSSAAAGGMDAAFGKVDRMAVTLRRDGATILDTLVAVPAAGSEIRASLRIDLSRSEESLSLALQLRQGDRPLFSGDAAVLLRQGTAETVDVPIAPVAAGVRISRPVDPLQGPGATMRLSGAVVFATGDTIPGAPIAWSTLDPAVVQVSQDGVLLSRAPGQARVVGSHAAVADTVLVQVAARPGAIVGVVRSAVNGAGIAGASVVLRSGASAGAGAPVVASATAGPTGSFALRQLPAGAYTLFASASGFIDVVVTGITVASDRETSQDAVLSPAQQAGETRIVLTWGASPRDIDSYITGPNGAGGTFTVYYSNRGSRTASPFTLLDIDDTSGHGPETVTIYRQFQGNYCYSVENFSGEAPLSASGARVQVYQNNREVASFSVPNQAGVLWTVFKLNGETITPVNTMSNGNAPGACP